MAKICNLNDFIELTSNITSFSHAYLFKVNSLEVAFPYIKEFAKMIICDKSDSDYEKISYQIDNNEFDDLYIVNPDTIGINTDEINKLLSYMETKSLRPEGKRAYIIYGYERLSRDVSNKILKFLEEPNENIFALLITENMDKILSTIVSRCQVISLTFEIQKEENVPIDEMKKFLEDICIKKYTTIAYINQYFYDIIGNRSLLFDFFTVLEKIISANINYRYDKEKNKEYLIEALIEVKTNNLINILDITNKVKVLIKTNMNLNLLIDRYIIEISRELILC